MSIIYRLTGFNNYLIKDKILYRKPYKTKSGSCVFQYRTMRAIKRTIKQNVIGYYLVKNGERKFYSLKSLRHRLKKVNI